MHGNAPSMRWVCTFACNVNVKGCRKANKVACVSYINIIMYIIMFHIFFYFNAEVIKMEDIV